MLKEGFLAGISVREARWERKAFCMANGTRDLALTAA